ncbi:hypothetical protein LS73_000560 [Helicobacter muridarum]|uniref:Uncharacterized protein n=1 Tax=Helicobacter muridarum TaxID=216 RepID=A0A099TYS2_9HELI|nr:hypothetical protein [Helicobacter muridarum]TLE01664.1 hypothetical protein LS73_000560 [Helicobacter muridarum]STQ86288.1 Uncharacterised protein [Helicobacter muridarum]
MCILCGQMISSFHWSDMKEMDSQEYKRSKLKKARIISEILQFYGLYFKIWQNSKFIISDKKGKTIIVDDLGELWARVEEILGMSADPLDANLLRFLENTNSKQ